MNQSERRSSRFSLVVTVSLQLALLVVFYLITAWQAPDPPLPVYGIELSMSTSTETTSSTESSSEERLTEDNSAQTAIVEEENEEAPENPANTSEEETSEEKANQAETEALNEKIQTLTEAGAESTSGEESIDEVNEKEEAEQNLRVNENSEEEIDSKEIAQNAVSSDKQPVRDSIFATGVSENQNNVEKTKEAAAIDERALFPSEGTVDDELASNVVLNVSGYQLTEPPQINDTSNESGSITFKIIVADDGYAIPVQTVQTTLSPSVTAMYRDAISQLYFEKTSSQVPPETTGTIMFIIKAN